MDEGRQREIDIMAAILASLHMPTADDLFGVPQGSPRTAADRRVPTMGQGDNEED